MLEIREFQPLDILSLHWREPDKSITESLDNPLEIARQYAKAGPAWTAFWDGTPAFCAGVILLWRGLGEGWVLSSDLVAQHPFAFHRAIRKHLEEVIREHKLRRVQVAIPETHTTSCRWILRLGFLYESSMPKYGPMGDTYHRFARLT